MQTQTESITETSDLVALAVRDPLAFVEHRAEKGLPPSSSSRRSEIRSPAMSRMSRRSTASSAST